MYLVKLTLASGAMTEDLADVRERSGPQAHEARHRKSAEKTLNLEKPLTACATASGSAPGGCLGAARRLLRTPQHELPPGPIHQEALNRSSVQKPWAAYT